MLPLARCNVMESELNNCTTERSLYISFIDKVSTNEKYRCRFIGVLKYEFC